MGGGKHAQVMQRVPRKATLDGGVSKPLFYPP
jgi:hypothetical protein